ncbi:hypothetical protein ACWGI8_26480, partial [Streptomyces sp. NPDC054841]
MLLEAHDTTGPVHGEQHDVIAVAARAHQPTQQPLTGLAADQSHRRRGEEGAVGVQALDPTALAQASAARDEQQPTGVRGPGAPPHRAVDLGLDDHVDQRRVEGGGAAAEQDGGEQLPVVRVVG